MNRNCLFLVFMSVFATATFTPAQTFSTLYNFTSGVGSTPNLTNIDGVFVDADITVSGGVLYGAATYGGVHAAGVLYKINIDGSGFTILHYFTNSNDGGYPFSGPVLSGDTLYGVTSGGGNAGTGAGTIFKVKTDGTGFTVLYTLTGMGQFNTDGYAPHAMLLLSGDRLYGVAQIGGSYANGAVFSIRTNGSGFANLHSFGGDDGAHPIGKLLLVGDTLYGVTTDGGAWVSGTIFALKTDGTGFTNVYHFSPRSGFPSQTNNDGAWPRAVGLLLSGDRLYGTTSAGGTNGNGTIFSVKTNGTDFINLHNFIRNADGSAPWYGLTLDGNKLYGVTGNGGTDRKGRILSMNTDGSGYATVYSFSLVNGGITPASIFLADNVIYGTTSGGGSSSVGTVFRLVLPNTQGPQLKMLTSGTNIVLNWPTNFTGFAIQATTTPGSSNSWANVTATPSVSGSNYSVSFLLTNASEFFRLRSP